MNFNVVFLFRDNDKGLEISSSVLLLGPLSHGFVVSIGGLIYGSNRYV